MWDSLLRGIDGPVSSSVNRVLGIPYFSYLVANCEGLAVTVEQIDYFTSLFDNQVCEIYLIQRGVEFLFVSSVFGCYKNYILFSRSNMVTSVTFARCGVFVLFYVGFVADRFLSVFCNFYRNYDRVDWYRMHPFIEVYEC